MPSGRSTRTSPRRRRRRSSRIRRIDSSVNAAGGVLTAKQAPTGPAPPRRPVCAWEMSSPFYRRPTGKGRTNHVIPQLAAEPPLRPGAGPEPTPSRATGSHRAATHRPSSKSWKTAACRRSSRRSTTPSAGPHGREGGRLQRRWLQDLATANTRQQRRQRAPGQRRRHVPARLDGGKGSTLIRHPWPSATSMRTASSTWRRPVQ